MLPKATLISSAIMLLIGLGCALILQLELMQPGLDIFRRETLEFHHVVVALHVAAMSIGLPICFVGGLGCYLLREVTAYKLLFEVLGCVFLAAGIAGFLYVSILDTWFFNLASGRGAQLALIKDLFLPLMALLSFLSAITMLICIKGNRVLAIFSLCLVGPNLAAWGFMRVVLHNAGIDYLLYDTWYTTAAGHGAALIMSASLFAVAFSYRAKLGYTRTPYPFSGAISTIIILGVAALGLVWLWHQAMLGLQGMPTLYAVFNPVFTQLHVRNGIVGLIIALLSLVLILQVFSLQKRPEVSPSDVF